MWSWKWPLGHFHCRDFNKLILSCHLLKLCFYQGYTSQGVWHKVGLEDLSLFWWATWFCSLPCDLPTFIRISLQSKTLPPPYPFSFITNKAKSHSLTLPTSSGSFPISPHSYFLKDSLAFLVTSCILENMSYEEYSFKILQQFADRGDQAIWNLRETTDNEKTGWRKEKLRRVK